MTRTLITLLLASLLGTAQAQSFTYRGSLEDGGEPAQGRYDLRLSLYADRLGTQVLAAPLELNDVAVTDGRFAVGLDFADLPAGIGTGWLEVAVQSGDEGNWETLEGRSEVLLDGLVCPTPWGLEGNAGTNAAINFLGTTDNAALEFRVSNERILRLEPPRQLNDFFGANILGGSAGNELGPNAVFATIAGGGGTDLFGNPLPNRALGIGDFIGGGAGNTSGTGIEPFGEGSFAVVVGGRQNQATGSHSFLGGGDQNRVTGEASVLVGGSGNRAEGRLSVAVGGSVNLAFGEQSFTGAGSSNRSFGADSVIVGGFGNATRGFQSTVVGGSKNCAGGDLSWAGGARAKIRPGNAVFPEPVGGACRNVPQTGDSMGDRGTFVWADSQDADFVSTGANQFLVRANGGMVLQRSGFGENPARLPRGVLTVVREPSGLNQPSSPGSTTVAVFENDNGGNIVVLAGGTDNKGYRFGTPDSLFHGGILYSSSGDMLFRNNNNQQRMAIRANGEVEINVLASAGGTSLCRNGQRISECSSSARYKKDVEAITGDEALRLLQQLRPVRYEWIDSGRADIGLVAEEVADVIPAIVTYKADGQIEGFEYNRLGPLLVAGFQEQQSANQRRFTELESAYLELGTEHAELAAENAQLRAEVAALKIHSGQMRELADRHAELERQVRRLAERDQDELRARLAALEALLLDHNPSLADASP